jgi:hypothetical protein
MRAALCSYAGGPVWQCEQDGESDEEEKGDDDKKKKKNFGILELYYAHSASNQ